MNRSPKYLLLLALLYSFAFTSLSQAALNKESKVIPLKESNYHKENIGPKKAVRKVQTPPIPSNTKPSSSTAHQSVGQSGTSKTVDNEKANDFFNKISAKANNTVVNSDSNKASTTTNANAAASTRASVQTNTAKTPAASSKPIIANSSKNNAPTGKITSTSAIKITQPKDSKTETSQPRASTAISQQKTTTQPKATVSTASQTKSKQSKTAAPTTSQAKTTQSKVTTSTVSQPQASQTIKKENLKEEKTARKERIKEPDLRVKLGSGSYENVKIIFQYGGQILNSKGKRIKALKANEEFSWTSKIENKEVKPQKGKKSRNNKKPEKPLYLNETITFKPNKELFKFNEKEYRGLLAVKFTSSGATAVNIIGIEDYLRGVVGSEIGASSPDESLKAQAVIARTYAYAHKGRHCSDNADICSTTHCQVYSGVKAERSSVDNAVKATKAYVLVYNGTPITALYFATCGGMTSNNSDVFGGTQLPYLTRVPCNFCTKGSKYRWNKEISIPDLRAALAKENVTLGEAYDIKIEAPSKMDRVSYMVFQTKNGEQKIKGTTVRRIFDLPSTTFVLGDRTEATNAIALAKSAVEAKPVKYKNFSNIMINGFANPQQSPKQLLVYCAGGLVRAKMPADGWKCISYDFKNAAISTAKTTTQASSVNSNMTSKYASKPSKVLKPITKINLFGRGYGHQVGMCQSGAVEMGKQGWNYRQILAHYYHGVTLKSLGY